MSRHWMNPNLIYVSQNFRDNRFAVHFLSVFKCKCSWFFQKIILLARLYHLLIAGFKSSRASLLLTLRKRLKVPISLLLKFLTLVKMLVLGQALDLGHLLFNKRAHKFVNIKDLLDKAETNIQNYHACKINSGRRHRRSPPLIPQAW